LLSCSEDELVELLKTIVVWRFGKVSGYLGSLVLALFCENYTQ